MVKPKQADVELPNPSQGTFAIDTPGLIDLLLGEASLGILSCLYRNPKPMGVEQLAKESGLSQRQVQSELAALIDAQLVERVRSRARARAEMFALPNRIITLLFDPKNLTHLAIHSRISKWFEARSTRDIERAFVSQTPSLGNRIRERRLFWLRAEPKDVEILCTIRKMLDDTITRIAAGQERERKQGTHVAVNNLHVAFAITPIEPDPRVMPFIQARQPSRHAETLLRSGSSSHWNLSEREKELHGLLLTEATLATIAKAMGVQRTTVATLAARLYRKLGVKGRVGLAPLALGRTGSTR